MKLNFGCGSNRIEGFENIDINANPNVDRVLDIREHLNTFEAESVDQIVCFHTLEHVERFKVEYVLFHFSRMLKIGSTLTLSFPDFRVCSQYYIENKRGGKLFWEATVFGRNAFPHDQHKCALLPEDVRASLFSYGMGNINIYHEPVPNECNAVVHATKLVKTWTYADTLKEI